MLGGRFVGYRRPLKVGSQTQLFSREELRERGALPVERGCGSVDSSAVEAQRNFRSQLVSADAGRDKLSQSK